MLRWVSFLRMMVFLALFVGAGLGLRSYLRSASEPSETIQERFFNYSTRLTSVRRLQLARIDQIEVFERTSVAALFGNRLKLPEVVIRATMPVEYNYHVDLSRPWSFDLQEGELVVTAPELEPSTPAGDISKLRFEVRKGSFFRDEKAVARAMQEQMTELLRGRAEGNLHLARETARKELESLLRSWTSSEGKSWRVQVRFSDEGTPHP